MFESDWNTHIEYPICNNGVAMILLTSHVHFVLFRNFLQVNNGKGKNWTFSVIFHLNLLLLYWMSVLISPWNLFRSINSSLWPWKGKNNYHFPQLVWFALFIEQLIQFFLAVPSLTKVFSWNFCIQIAFLLSHTLVQ